MKKITIKGQQWTVNFVPIIDGDEHIKGQTNFETQEILIKTGRSLGKTSETIAHELTHAYMFESGSPVSDDEDEFFARFIGRNFEEMTINLNEILRKEKKV